MLLKKTGGDRIKVKSSGVIVTVEDALSTIEYGVDRVGNDAAAEWMEDFDNNVRMDG